METKPHPNNLHIEAIRDAHAGITAQRSPHWRKVHDEHLKRQPACAACGSGDKLNVHHKAPFHLHPELELDPANLITLCMAHHCHILIGHGDDFKAFNPDVVEDAAMVAADFARLSAVAIEAKTKRRYE